MLPSIAKKLKAYNINSQEECKKGANCGKGKSFKRLISFKGKKKPSHPGPGVKTKSEKYVSVPTKTVETEVVTGKVAGGAAGNFPGIAKVETYESTPVMTAGEEAGLEETQKTKGRETAYKLHKKKKTVTY